MRQTRTVVTGILLAASLVAMPAQGERRPQPDDFIDFAGFQALELSPGGDFIYAATRRLDPEENERINRHWLIPTDSPGERRELTLPAGSQSVTWHPDGERLVMIARSEENRPPQVVAGPAGEASYSPLTAADAAVTDFDLSRDGTVLAFTTAERSRADGGNDRRGVSVDVGRFSKVKLLNDGLGRKPGKRRSQLWVQTDGPDTAEAVANDYSVSGFAVSPTGDRVALTAVEGRQRPGMVSKAAHLMVHDLDTATLTTLQEGRDGVDGSIFEGRVAHSSPHWAPSGRKLAFLRTDYSYGMARVADLGVHDFGMGETRFPVRAENRELAPRGMAWRDDDTLLVERVADARQGLYRLTLPEGRLEPARVSNDSHEQFTFDAEAERAAWVEQATDRRRKSTPAIPKRPRPAGSPTSTSGSGASPCRRRKPFSGSRKTARRYPAGCYNRTAPRPTSRRRC